MQQLKDNLVLAQNRMKKYADTRRIERSFWVGDPDYLKIAPYRLAAFVFRGALKLQNRYYGPFRVIQKVGNAAYTLQLPSGVQIHPVFHVSQLKKHIGDKAIPDPHLPLVNQDGTVKVGPSEVLEVRQVP